MKTKAVRMYGTRDLRLEEFELPEIKDDEILVKIMSDSICMSTYKLAEQGKKHKRAPQNIDTNPIIIGHEFAGVIVEVGEKWKDQFKPGMKFAQQPALNYKGSLASPGYSYEYFGGACTYCIIPHEVMELGCLMPYDGDSFFEASLGEPMSCIIGGYHGNYHTNKRNHDLSVGTKEGGDIIILGGCGPMGLGAVSYGIQIEKGPKRIVVTDIDDAKIERAREVIPEAKAAENGVELLYVNTAKMADPVEELKALTGGKGYDDDYVVKPFRVAELVSRIMANVRRISGGTDIYKDETLTVDFKNKSIMHADKQISVSPTEFHVLEILINNKGLIVRRDTFFQINISRKRIY